MSDDFINYMNNDVSILHDKKEKKKIKKDKKGYLLSIILTVIFTLIAFVPGVLSLLYLGYFIGPLYILPPIAGMFGYLLGRAPLNKTVYLLTYLVSFFANTIVMRIVYKQFAKIANVSFQEIKSAKGYGYNEDLFMSLVFLLIGMFIVHIILSMKKKKEIKK